MRRFMLNRWWAYILVLLMGVAGAVAVPRASRADDTGGKSWLGDGGDTTLPPVPSPQGAGDPDSPSQNSSPTTYVKSGSSATSSGRVGSLSATSAGDARALGQARIWWQVRFALRAMKGYYLRF